MRTDHEKCNVECLNQAIRHQNAAIDKLGHLLELHQGTDTDHVTQLAMATVFDALQCIDIVNVIYKRQLNAYDETRVYKRDCGQLVPKPADTSKTDWRDGSVARSVKTKKQAPHQEMAAVTAPPRLTGGRGGPRPPAAVPIVGADIVP